MRNDEEQEALRQYRIQQRVQEMQAQDATRAQIGNYVELMRRRLMWSRVFLYGGGVIGVIYGLVLLGSLISQAGQSAETGAAVGSIALGIVALVVIAPISAYQFWAFYWGWIWTWGWMRGIGRSLSGCLEGIALTFFILFFLEFAVCIASLYGTFGGGIYQYRKAKDIVARGSAIVSGTAG